MPHASVVTSIMVDGVGVGCAVMGSAARVRIRLAVRIVTYFGFIDPSSVYEKGGFNIKLFRRVIKRLESLGLYFVGMIHGFRCRFG